MGLLDGKNTVILGASSGIGWRIAERFAEEGANLLIAARRLDNLKKLGKQIDASVTRCDVTDFDDVGRLAETAKERLGSVERRAGGSSGAARRRSRRSRRASSIRAPSSTPRMSTPRIITSRLAPAANPFCFHFFFTDFTERSLTLLEGRTSAQAVTSPASSSTA